MASTNNSNDQLFQPIEDESLLSALNEVSRTINLITTYSKSHPVVDNAIKAASVALQALFIDRKKVLIGAFNGALTIDEKPVKATGTLLKSLERRLVKLQITGLKLSSGITEDELVQLAELLSAKDAEEFQSGIGQSGMSHISSENTQFRAVREGETVASDSDLAKQRGGMGDGGLLVLDDDELEDSSGGDGGSGSNDVHVEQIVAFLKGDMDMDEAGVGDELADLASDPNQLGKLIMESVAVRQAASELSGESLNDIILGCLRRTYNGLRKQSAFQSKDGMADLQKSLLLLEESILDRMRDITGEPDPALDRQIVQAIRNMDESIGFEMAAMEYMEHQEAINANAQQLQAFVQARGADAAQELLNGTDFPSSDWHRIVIESGQQAGTDLPAGLNNLASVFEKLETLIKSEHVDDDKVRDLLGQATENLDGATHHTKEKLESLSKQLIEDEAGTIGGRARNMSREGLLAALAEIAQELMQPLTAINASLEMLIQGYLGDVTNDQRDMLSLASDSGEHLTYLMKMLVDIVGCPTNKGVDIRFHTTSDEVAKIRDTEGEELPPLRFAQ